MNKKELFNAGWEFAKSGLDVSESAALEFVPVDLPHDWLVYNTLDLYENSIGWYRKTFYYSKKEEDVILCFDGVYMDSSVYVNQQLVGEWKYGYSSFEHQITDALAEGENEILVKVVHQSPNSRWYSGAGIYRNVWLKTRGKNHIATDGIYISTAITEQGWQVDIDVEVSITEAAQISHSIMYQDQLITQASGTITTANSSGIHHRQTMVVDNPLLWSPDEPRLYQLQTELIMGVTDHAAKQPRNVVESVTQNLGFRSIVLDPDQGLQLNGKKVKLNGVCEHHDLGALGAAFNKAALKRRLTILKEMGANAIRTAHNMPAPELMDLADELGFLVVSEAFDMWERAKTPYDYARFFKDWCAVDVKSWVRRDRNHPSLLMWSIGNEIYDTHADEKGQQITTMLMKFVQQHDPKENARVTIGSNYMPWENAQKCADIVKVAGYNYAEKYYQQHHQEHPDWIIYGSETASVVQSRGIYHFPYEKSILADDDEQCSALGNSSTSWGAKSAEACIIAERDTSFSLGQFIWTGFDYIGEPTPYHTKNAYFGQIDTATFKKDSYYIYQAAWTDYKKKPMVHLFPYWDFNDGQVIDVRVCSNAPKIELQLNGDSIGTHLIDHEHGTELVGWWKVPFERGELTAIAYDENGEVIATDVKRSFKDADSISLTADTDTITANGTDLIFLEISMKDEDGNEVENATNRVTVKVTGAGRLLGLDNGDSTDYDQYKGVSKRLFSGKLMAIIGATLKPGKIDVEVSSPGLDKQVGQFTSLPVCDKAALKGVSAQMGNQRMRVVLGREQEIPLRKVEIISDAGQLLNESQKELVVRAKLYPENTSYREIEWSVVNDTGIPSSIATVEPAGLEATVSALGDGSFRLRCTSKNGNDKTKLISELEFQAAGLGTAYKDPYSFLSAGLYDYSKGEVGNGNERGIATSRDGVTEVGFHGIDFGSYGSDTITLPIFALTSEPYSLQIWEGSPGEEGSDLLADVIYQKEPKWNVYQEETYRLSRKLRGITSICFILKQKVHIKGFYFEKQNRAFEKNQAAACDRIYGDSYTVKEGRVEGIGNNVSLEFNDLDFTSDGTSSIVISGRAPLERNTLQIKFTSEEGETSQIVEFTQSYDYVEKEFPLEKMTGMQKVTFLFLPGSHFDFGWFRFETDARKGKQ
nr:glycoside hydrolase family 2 TIM barrel-domain containing protein [Evansella caseinilytica]